MCVCVCMYVRARARARACVCVQNSTMIAHTHTYTRTRTRTRTHLQWRVGTENCVWYTSLDTKKDPVGGTWEGCNGAESTLSSRCGCSELQGVYKRSFPVSSTRILLEGAKGAAAQVNGEYHLCKGTKNGRKNYIKDGVLLATSLSNIN